MAVNEMEENKKRGWSQVFMVARWKNQDKT